VVARLDATRFMKDASAAALGAGPQARAELERAVEAADRQGALLLKIRALVSLARLTDAPETVENEITRVLEVLDAGGGTPDGENARRVLRERQG